MKIAIEGCAHGELENIYNTLQLLEEKKEIKIDLLICCGDFQSTRNEVDLKCMAVPDKYLNICTFYKYYNGEKTAPVLTIFIGGNHEASNYLQELPYGGWVAPNIYYMGYASVINIAGIRIGGLSGIYKYNDYMRGHFEIPPYNDKTKRSVYHIRNLDVFRLKQLSGPLDIFLSHEWPSGVWDHGDVDALLKTKPYFRDDIESGKLGNQPCAELLHELKPVYWFAAHLHCKFAAVVPHPNEKTTRFLALDKCLPRRKFLQIVDIAHDTRQKMQITHDLEWLTILHLTNHLLSVKPFTNYMPNPKSNERWSFTPSDADKTFVAERLQNNLVVPCSFERTSVGYGVGSPGKLNAPNLNQQTVRLCDALSIDDPLSLVAELSDISLNVTNDSECSFVNVSLDSPGKVLGNLSLPEPKLATVEGSASPVRVSSGGGEVELEVGAEEETEVETPPSVKKFKRRNASMYEDSGTS